MTTVDHYFDYVSPFSYLLHEQLHRLPAEIKVNHIPVLFAGLLKHWGSLGPVEIERKRLFTYRHCTWLADKLGVQFRVPDTHPFNPLPYLRLTIAKENDPRMIASLFKVIWTCGHDPATESGRKSIWKEIGIEEADSFTSAVQVKQKLISNVNNAVERGVFGVPTLIVDGELFWGLDSLDVLLDYFDNPGLFDRSEMKRLTDINYFSKN